MHFSLPLRGICVCSKNFLPSVNRQTDYACSYYTKNQDQDHAATPPTASPSCKWTDRLHLLILHQDLQPHLLLLLHPVNGHTNIQNIYIGDQKPWSKFLKLISPIIKQKIPPNLDAK